MHSKHHTTPISLGGLDKECNIINLEQPDHDLIHHTCDMSYKLYHTLNRKMKSKMNGHIVMPEDALKIQHEMQHRFHEWYDYLPERLQKLIDEVRKNTLQHWNKELANITKDKFDISFITHREWLMKEHEMQLIIQKELLSILKALYRI